MLPTAGTECTITTPGPINFGIYNPLSTFSDNVYEEMQINCSGTGSVSYTVNIAGGNAGSAKQRYMEREGTTDPQLNYNIYNDRGKIWKDGQNGTYHLIATEPLPANMVYSIAAKIPARQKNIFPGVYSDDTVNIEMTY